MPAVPRATRQVVAEIPVWCFGLKGPPRGRAVEPEEGPRRVLVGGWHDAYETPLENPV